MNQPQVEPVNIDPASRSWFSRVQRSVSRTKFRVTSDWLVNSSSLDCVILIPQGFITDGASIPRFLWWVPGLSPYGPLFRAAIVHDYMYKTGVMQVARYTGKVYPYESCVIHQTRREADRVFFQLAKEWTGLRLTPRLAYLGVRVFGWAFYAKA